MTPNSVTSSTLTCCDGPNVMYKNTCLVDWFGKSTLKADDDSNHEKNAATVVWTTGGLARLRIEHITLGGSQETFWLRLSWPLASVSGHDPTR